MSDIILTAYSGSILGPIAKVLGLIMNWIYEVMSAIGIENISLTIILFTIVIYMCLFPITFQQQKFSKLTQKMQPELSAVQKKYKGKKDQTSMMAMQDETKIVYEKYGVSPMGSCVYMLINMPILFALYRVFYSVPAYVSGVKDQFSGLVEGIVSTAGFQDKMAAFVEKMNLVTVNPDFTNSDPTVVKNYIVDVLYSMHSSGWDTLKESFGSLSSLIDSTEISANHINSFIGLNISDTPMTIIQSNFSLGNFLIIFIAILIPVISYLTQVLNIKLMPQTPTNGDNDAMANQMKVMNKIMPLFSLVFCFTVPVGLGIYWIISALVRSIQQYLLNRHFDKVDLEKLIKKNQEKAKKKREKKGIVENQINSAAKLSTKKIDNTTGQQSDTKVRVNQKNSQANNDVLEKAAQQRNSARPGSLSAKANKVKEFNEKNSK